MALTARRAADLPVHYNAVEILEHNLATRADRPALHTDARECTFGELAAETNRVGNALLAGGVRFGDCVAILVPDRVEWVTTYFATLKIGAIALSLNTLLTPGELAQMLADARAGVLVVDAALLPAVAELELDHLERVIVVDGDGEAHPTYADWIAGASEALEAARTHRDDVCCLNYSSGTTGEPKGIPHAHKDLPLTAQLWGVRTSSGIKRGRTARSRAPNCSSRSAPAAT